MKCFFCNHVLFNEDTYCYHPPCKDAQVVYFYHNILEDPKELYKVGFTAKINQRTFFVDYILNPSRNQKMVCQIKNIYIDKESGGAGFRTLLTIPYPPLTLTPTNYQNRLPTYLTFS